MANSDTKTGQLDGNDILFPAPGRARADEYDLITSAIGQPVTLSLTATDPNSYNTFLEVINAETSALIADSDDTEPFLNINSLIAPGLPTIKDGINPASIPNSLHNWRRHQVQSPRRRSSKLGAVVY